MEQIQWNNQIIESKYLICVRWKDGDHIICGRDPGKAFNKMIAAIWKTLISVMVHLVDLFYSLKPACVLELAEGMRPPEPEPEAVVEEKEEDKKERKSSTSSSSSSSSSDDEKDEEKKEKKRKKKEKKAAKAAAVAAAAAAASAASAEVGTEVEEKKDDVKENTEEVVETKEELVETAAEDAALVVSDGEGGNVTEKVIVSEQKSYTKQTSTTDEKGTAEQVFGQEFSTFTTESETSRSVVTSTRVVSSKVITSTSATRVISSDGTTVETIENGDEKVSCAVSQS